MTTTFVLGLVLTISELLGLNGVFSQSNGDVRLVGNSSYRGRVEVYYQGQWRTACYYGWDENESAAVCKQLGYTRVLSTTGVSPSESSSDKVSVFCSTSSASSLYACHIMNSTSLYCSWFNSYQPLVECTNSSLSDSSQLSNGETRLVGGSSRYVGRVEVYYRGEWRTVCYSGWNHGASSVVCKQLGYGPADEATSTYISRSSSNSVSVYCNGYENSLDECRISSYTYSCYYQAVVVCANSIVEVSLILAITIPIVCGLFSLCALCVSVVVAYCLHCKQKPRVLLVHENVPKRTVRYTTSVEQPRIGYHTLPPSDGAEDVVEIHYHAAESWHIGEDPRSTGGQESDKMDQPQQPPPEQTTDTSRDMESSLLLPQLV